MHRGILISNAALEGRVSVGGLDSSPPPSFRAARPSAPPFAIVVAGRPSLAGAAAAVATAVGSRPDTRTCRYMPTRERRARRPCRRRPPEVRATKRRQECILRVRVSQNHSRNPNRFPTCLPRPSNFGIVCETIPPTIQQDNSAVPAAAADHMSRVASSHSLGSQGRARQRLATFTPSFF